MPKGTPGAPVATLLTRSRPSSRTGVAVLAGCCSSGPGGGVFPLSTPSWSTVSDRAALEPRRGRGSLRVCGCRCPRAARAGLGARGAARGHVRQCPRRNMAGHSSRHPRASGKSPSRLGPRGTPLWHPCHGLALMAIPSWLGPHCTALIAVLSGYGPYGVSALHGKFPHGLALAAPPSWQSPHGLALTA